MFFVVVVFLVVVVVAVAVVVVVAVLESYVAIDLQPSAVVAAAIAADSL